MGRFFFFFLGASEDNCMEIFASTFPVTHGKHVILRKVYKGVKLL